jgi:hypothetical protein
VNSTAPPYRVDGSCPSGVPFNNASSPTDGAVIAAVRAARGLGLRVVLRPMIDPHWGLAANRGEWRGNIGRHFGPAEWDAWFASYRVFLLHWAAIAAAEHVEAYANAVADRLAGQRATTIAPRPTALALVEISFSCCCCFCRTDCFWSLLICCCCCVWITGGLRW